MKFTFDLYQWIMCYDSDTHINAANVVHFSWSRNMIFHIFDISWLSLSHSFTGNIYLVSIPNSVFIIYSSTKFVISLDCLFVFFHHLLLLSLSKSHNKRWQPFLYLFLVTHCVRVGMGMNPIKLCIIFLNWRVVLFLSY